MSENTAIFAIFVLSTMYFIICIMLDCGVWWYDTVYCFFIGILLAKYKSKVIAVYEKYKLPLLCLSGITTIVLIILMSKGWSENIIILFLGGFAAISLVIALFVTIQMKSPIFSFVGEMSWEIFLTHSTLHIFVYKDNVEQKGYTIILIIILVMIVSYILHILSNKVMGIIKK